MKEAASNLNTNQFDKLIKTCEKIKHAARHGGAHRIYYIADLI